ncbi:MAG TPA: SulP family inorganic anion transporter [Gammaproteobacteria bacterium]|nr:SulP family inorganic anion transporter [Gammaproteobacteria bacterium]
MKFDKLAGDFWGGLAAMLVALPSAIAFGVTIYSPMGSSYAAQGALAGILGVTALGLLASVFGGTNRLITAPCAPAAAVLSAFVIEFLGHGEARLESLLLMVALLGLLAGVIQITFGVVGLGRLIKYMPYPVVSGYLSGVGLYIIASQVPKFLGVPKESHFWESLIATPTWRWQGVVVGVVTIAVMLVAPKITKVVPAAILALVSGVLAYFGLGLLDGSLIVLSDNPLIVGPLGSTGGNFIEVMAGRWSAVGKLTLADLEIVAMPALTLAVLLSIDTLKTCVVLDALTRSRHDSNRELIGQGIGNVTSSIIGGIPGAGQMGATLVNLSSGARSRLSGIVEGILALIAFLVLGTLIAWVPVASLAGILIVIGVRMIDLHTLNYLKSRSTVLDFVVIVAVVIVALTVSLIAASGTGIVLAILLFVREQIGGRVVRRKAYGDATFSKQIRPQAEMEILIQQGGKTVIFELQGSLFFGTADQLYTALEPEFKKRTYVILDMRRVQSVDVTATHTLGQIKDMLAERNGFLIFCQIPWNLPSGRDMKQYFDQVGLVRPDSPVKVFGEVDEAIEWVEDRILAEAALARAKEKPLELNEIELFKERKAETLTALEACMEKRACKAGEAIFARGDTGDELFLIRRGEVRIMLPVDETHSHHISTFGRGAFFGEMSFLDGKPRSATAIAYSDTDLYVLPRKMFDRLSGEHKRVSLNLLEGLAKMLAARLRYADMEIHALES